MVGSSKPPLCPRCGSVMSWHRAAGGSYCDTDGAVEVFPERRPDGSSTLGIRPSNHYGQLVIAFAAEGHITDVTWEAA